MADKPARRALVTGCCGFIGSHLASSLLEAGWHVDGVDDMSRGNVSNVEHLRGRFGLRVVPVMLVPSFERSYEKSAPAQFLVFEGDFCSPAVLRRVVAGYYDVIFHLAAEPSVEISVNDPAGTSFNNLQKSTELMSASVGAVNRFVFASSAAVYGAQEQMPISEEFAPCPESPYALQKLQVEETGELFSRLYGLDFIALRMFNVYGPRQAGSSPYSTVVASWCDKLKNNKPLRLDGDGTQSRDLIYVADVCSAFLSAARPAEMPGFHIFNVATGVAHTNNYILRQLKGWWPQLKVNRAPPRKGDVKHSVASIDKIVSSLDFSCSVDLLEGLNLTLKSHDLLSD